MFSADLSWTDDTVERVGDRRERKTKERDSSIASSSSSQNDPKRPPTRKGSISAKTSFSSVKGSFRRPSISGDRRFKKSALAPIDPASHLKDPSQQPDWVLSAKLSPTLPSGAPLDPPPPFLEASPAGTSRITYSRQTNHIREFCRQPNVHVANFYQL